MGKSQKPITLGPKAGVTFLSELKKEGHLGI